MYALELKDVTKKYSQTAVNHLSFALKAGTVFGFLGPNGAGKTTTMRMVVGLAKPDSGEIKIFNHPAGTVAAMKELGFMPENPRFYQYLTGLEFVTMHGQLAGLAKKSARNRASALLNQVGLTDSQTRSIRGYSKGMVQRLGLAQALIGDPKILFLDEPLDGLDAFGRAEMKKLIQDLRKQKITIFFNSHILSDVEEMCDQIGIIDRGVLLEIGETKSFLKPHQTLEQFFVDRINQSRLKEIKK
ncbi:MAG: ABC transporter ATP-binding protein [Patescibacteria group bacterium]|jgi:ABC-2 type transport system ATP-binding protein